MNLPEELVSELVKVTSNNTPDKTNNTAYGTVVDNGGRLYVRLDGADEGVLTPVETTVSIKAGDRVRVSIRNHTAVVTGNAKDNSASLSELLKAINLINDVSDNVNGIGILLNGNGEVEGLVAKVNQNGVEIDNIGTRLKGYVTFESLGENGTTEIHGSRIKTGTINAKEIIMSGTIDSSILDESLNNKIDSAQNAADNADNAIEILDKLTDGGFTSIDGSKIATNSIYANRLCLGGEMTVYKSKSNSDNVGGYLGWSSGFASTTGIGIMDSTKSSQMVCTDQAARLSHDLDAQFIASSNKYAYIVGNAIVFAPENNYQVVIVDGCLRPHIDAPDNITLGSTAYKWANIYAKTGEGIGSDRNIKNSIEDLPEKYLTLFDKLIPKRFKLNDGTSGRYHVGYIAQEVEEAMNEAGVDSQEFGGFIKDVHEKDGSDIYMLRYGEFDAIYAAKIKQLEARINDLEERLKAAEGVG